MKYLITGGSGFIGSNFIESLSQNDDKVVILSRSKKGTVGNCTFINDLSKIKNEEYFDCIINLAGKKIDCRWTQKNQKELIDSRVNVTKAVLGLIKRLLEKPKVMISASAIGYYGDHNNKVIKEDYKPKQSFTHTLCSVWEKEAVKASKHGVRVIVARLGVVLGKNGGFIKKTYCPFKMGLGGRFGSGEQIFSWIHISDVINAFQYMIHNKKCKGAYNFVALSQVTNKELIDNISCILKTKLILHMPEYLVKILFGKMGQDLLLKGNKIIPDKLIKDGYKFKYDSIKNALNDIYNKI